MLAINPSPPGRRDLENHSASLIFRSQNAAKDQLPLRVSIGRLGLPLGRIVQIMVVSTLPCHAMHARVVRVQAQQRARTMVVKSGWSNHMRLRTQ